MPEDDEQPRAADEHAASTDGQLLARLDQLERAIGQQSARLRAIEQRLGLVDYTSTPRPFAQGAATGSTATPHAEQQPRPPQAREEQPEDANPHAEAKPGDATPFVSHWRIEPESGQTGNAAGAREDARGRGAGVFNSYASNASNAARKPLDLETLVGGSLFKWVGIIFVTLAVGFFLKVAFENQWIGERFRIVIGGAAGLGVLALGERLRTRGYRSYAYVISGGGILILYLTVYAARVFYDLIGVLPAFVLMVGVTAAAVLLAARHNALPVAILGLIGGFMTPVLLSTGVDNQIALFTYIALLNSGVLALAYFKRWRSLNHMAFVATVLMFAGWYFTWYAEAKLWTTLFFLTLFFLMFNALGVIYNVVKQRHAQWFDISLIISNATLYFGSCYTLLEAHHHPIIGSFALVWSAFYVLLFYFTYQRHRADQLLSLSYVGAAVTFFTLAVAIQLDQHWVTMAWGMEGLMLTWIGLRADTDAPRYAALPVFAFALAHWFTTDMLAFAYHANEAFVPLLNRRAVSCAVLVATIAGAVWLYRRDGDKVEKDEREIIGAILILGANVLALTLLSVDANDYFNARYWAIDADDYAARAAVENARHFTLTVLWTFYALAALVIGVRRRLYPLRFAALAWLAVTGAKLLVFDTEFYNASWHLPLFNPTFAAFAAYVAALWYAGRLYAHSDRIQEHERGLVLNVLTVVANFFAIVALSLEATGYFEKLIRSGALNRSDTRDLRLAQGLSLSLVWMLYGGAMLLFGHRRENRLLRIMALVLLTATTVKVFFLDLAELEKFYRIISFLVLGAILLAVSFLYQRASKAEDG
ncbi:MAG TPA: DUF2339 domain-containing protein [Pyrinomonadaceae bacterium]|nr:DUF2339 domain-containing protein [Pyrinomonadaceae bacterium]